MTTEQYLRAIRKLGLTPAGQSTALAFGLSLRQVQRIAHGHCAVPGPLAKLLRIALRQGLTVAYLTEL